VPYSLKQNALFRAAAHNPAIAKSSGIPMQTAKKLASEGVKRKTNKFMEKIK
jgi:hypothetical protein